MTHPHPTHPQPAPPQPTHPVDPRPLIRIATAGSVDDGKSTFLGRLLYEGNAILDDQWTAVQRASAATGEADVNLALLTDGLRAEREQKITIDVAYRHFATARRRYLLADTPGHAQYTRNMMTGASTAEVAILLVDAERGPTPQTRRHAFIVSLLRVPHVIIAVNKMDRVGYAEPAYDALVRQLRTDLARLEFADLRFIPISALVGDNVSRRSAAMPWYPGPSVLETLDSLEVETRRTPVELRFPVQLAVRPSADFRAYAGTVVSGQVSVGDPVRIQPGPRVTTVTEIWAGPDRIPTASVGEAVLLRLADDLDIARGDVIVRTGNPSPETDAFEGTVCVMHETGLAAGDAVQVQIGRQEVAGQITDIRYEINAETFHRADAARLPLNALARVAVRLSRPVALDRYEHNRDTGAFLLVDPVRHHGLAAGVVTHLRTDLPPADAVPTQSRPAPSRPAPVFWLTGLSGAGKSTLAESVATRLRSNGQQAGATGRSVVILDGDAVRRGVNRDLGYSAEARTENVRRIAEIARLLSDQGHIVLCSVISPLAAQRESAREIIGSAFHEIAIVCDLATLRQRDPKGLYARADRGEIAEFTGVSSPYEPPSNPDLTIDTSTENLSESIQKIWTWILAKL
ncbi:MAG: adenylyl-sulfate kinase [Fimbriimonadaceae bacterium]|nr:adenylyl-sulfate kinase [Fimbriimonadaceae bacterium]